MKELTNLIHQNEDGFEKHFSYPPSYTASAPGRINIIGEHTDYNFGFSLATGINRWVIVSIKKRADSTVNLYSANYNASLNFKIGDLIEDDKEKWKLIVSGLVKSLQQSCAISEGFDAYIWGNVPLGSGVSSSAAFEVAFYNAVRTLYNLPMNDTELVLACQKIEHEYLKVKSGLLDQYSSQFSNADNLILLDFKALSHEYIPAPLKEYQWVLVNTMVKRELSGSKYSERVEETVNALELIQKKFPEVKHFREIELHHLDAIKDTLLLNRIKHYVQENTRVHLFCKALEKSNVKEAGKLLTESHQSLKNLYEVSCDELDYLAEMAILQNGCLGSRMMGGGFGGCTINLVHNNFIEQFSKNISTLYKLRFALTPEITIYESVEGASATIVNHQPSVLSK